MAGHFVSVGWSACVFCFAVGLLGRWVVWARSGGSFLGLSHVCGRSVLVVGLLASVRVRLVGVTLLRSVVSRAVGVSRLYS